MGRTWPRPMSGHVLLTSLRTIHVLAAFAWLAMAFFLAWILPRIQAKLSPEAAQQVGAAAAATLMVPIAAASGTTVLLGLVMYAVMDPTAISMLVHLGALVGIAMFLIAMVWVRPGAKGIVAASQKGEAPQTGHLKRVRTGGKTVAWLGVVTILLMVAGAHQLLAF